MQLPSNHSFHRPLLTEQRSTDLDAVIGVEGAERSMESDVDTVVGETVCVYSSIRHYTVYLYLVCAGIRCSCLATIVLIGQYLPTESSGGVWEILVGN